jgi:hypothetical protein
MTEDTFTFIMTGKVGFCVKPDQKLHIVGDIIPDYFNRIHENLGRLDNDI